MKSIAYVGAPAHGHTNPAVPVLAELRRQGFRVRFYNASEFEKASDLAGAEFRRYPDIVPTQDEISRSLRELVDAAVLVSEFAAPLARHLLSEFATERPDLVIYDSLATWGYLSARTYAIPCACFVTTLVLERAFPLLGLGGILYYLWSALPYAHTLRSWKRDLRREFGKQVAGGICEYADQNIVFTSREFQPGAESLDESFSFVGPSLNRSLRPENPQGFFVHEDRPLVYISFGTLCRISVRFFSVIFRVAAELDADFVIAAPRADWLPQPTEIPNNCRVKTYWPQLEVLRVASVFVSHGGLNSVHESLSAGVPLLLVPQQSEQIMNAKRVHSLGAGIDMGRVRPDSLDPNRLCKQIRRLLSDDSFRTRATKIGLGLSTAGGWKKAAELIENRLHT